MSIISYNCTKTRLICLDLTFTYFPRKVVSMVTWHLVTLPQPGSAQIILGNCGKSSPVQRCVDTGLSYWPELVLIQGQMCRQPAWLAWQSDPAMELHRLLLASYWLSTIQLPHTQNWGFQTLSLALQVLRWVSVSRLAQTGCFDWFLDPPH